MGVQHTVRVHSAGACTRWAARTRSCTCITASTMMAVFFVCRNVMGIGEPHALANSLFLEFLPHLLACIARDGPQGSIKIFFA